MKKIKRLRVKLLFLITSRRVSLVSKKVHAEIESKSIEK